LSKDLPKLLGSSNEGTEFYMTFHPCWEETGQADGCKIYISSAVATRVTVEIPAKKIYIERTTIAKGIIEISLTPDQAQCYRKTDREQPLPQRVWQDYGIIVTSDDPIICYGVTRYRYTSDGYLAIPKSALGKNYVVASYNDPCVDNGSQYLPSYTSIVGVYDNTEVDIKLGGRFSNYTPGAKPLKTGDHFKQTINRGDVWLIGVMGDYNDLTGTTVNASKPLSVISGNFCSYIPIQTSACDFIIEQDLPMETWGKKYHVTRIINRLKGSILRVFASEPNTAIYRDGNEWAMVKTVGGAEGIGYIEKRSVSVGEELRPVTISALNNISVTQYNTGMSDDGKDSDPFQMVLSPVDQYQTSYFWCTPGVNGGSSFRYNYINLCYKSTATGQIPDDIEFGHVLDGVVNWRKLSTVVPNAGTEFIDSSITDNRYYKSLTITLEDSAGVYALKGVEPMMAYGYGFDWYDSYGYPVAATFNDFTKPDIWAPNPDYTMDCQGNVQGKVKEQPEKDETLRSNMASMKLVNLGSNNFSNMTYDKSNFIPGTTNFSDWTLKVLDIEKDGLAVLNFMDRAGNDTTITIEYKGTKLATSNKTENWGSKTYSDQIETKELTLFNESSKPVTVDSILLVSKMPTHKLVYNGFTIDPAIYKENGGVLPGYTLQPGEDIKIKVSFDPQTLEKEITDGQVKFSDSIYVKAEKNGDADFFCYEKSITSLQATIPFVGVEDLSGLTGLFDISPNPAGDKNVSINYSIKFDGVVELKLYNTNGVFIKELANSYQSSGSHLLSIPIDGLAQGTYYIEFKSGDVVQHKNFVIVR
ncbi:MAG: T9SS type A sorting domain-containing protein, partial [bacterium]